MQTDIDFKDTFFKDRDDASRKLIDILPKEQILEENWLLLTLASGAVPIAEMMASEFDLDYDLLFMASIYTPNNDECQIAKVSELKEIVMEDNLVKSFDISLDYIYAQADKLYQEKLLNDQYQYRNALPLTSIKNRNILLIDEGCETGIRAICAIKSVLAHGGKKVSLATPVIADDLFHHLDMMLDDIYANHVISDFIEVDYYYESLDNIMKKEVKSILKNSKNYINGEK